MRKTPPGESIGYRSRRSGIIQAGAMPSYQIRN